MANGDDVLLRVLADVNPATSNVERLRQTFLNAVANMEAAAARPDFDPLSAEARGLAIAVQRLGADFKKALDVAEKESLETGRALRAARTEAEGVDRALARLGKTGGGLAGLTGALRDIRNGLGQVGAALGVAFGGRQVVDFIKSSTQARIELQALRAQLDAAAGSTEAGGEAYDFARRKALELGFAINDVVASQARFEAATRQTNLTLAQRREIFESVINTSRVLQISQDRVNNAFLALEQIASKGRVSMEELRRQLGDQIPGVLPILAKQLGVTTGELIKMVEQGELMADVALPAIAKGLEETFGVGLQKALETDAALLGQIQTRVFELKATFAEGFADEFRAGLEDVNKALISGESGARLLGQAVGNLGQVSVPLAVRQFQLLTTAIRELRKVFPLLDAALTPIEQITEGMIRATAATESTKSALDKVADALRLSAKEQEKFAEKTFGSREELDKQASAILNIIEKTVVFGRAHREQADIALEALEDVRDGYLALGDAVPDDLSAAIEKMRLELERAEQAFALSTEGMKKFREELTASGPELETRSLQLLAFIEYIGGVGNATSEQAEAIEEETQKILDGFALIGEEPPAAFAALADSIDVTTSRIEEQRKEVQGLIGDLAKLAQIKTATPGADAGADLAKRREELEALEAKQREQGTLTLEEVERIGELKIEIDRLTDTYEKMGDTATASVDDINRAFLDLVRSNEQAFRSLPAAAQEAINVTIGNLQSLAQAGAATPEVIEDAVRRIADTLETFGGDVDEVREALLAAEDPAAALKNALNEVSLGGDDAATSMGRLGEETGKATEAQEEQTRAAEEHLSVLEKLRDRAKEVIGEMRTEMEGYKQDWRDVNELCQQHGDCIGATAA